MLSKRLMLVLMAVVIGMVTSKEAEAGLFDRLFKKRCKPACQPAPAPECCQPGEASAAVPESESAGLMMQAGPHQKVCMKDPPQPPGTGAGRCLTELIKDHQCCARKHRGYPNIIAACQKAAARRHQFCSGIPEGVEPIPHECDCTKPCTNYGCDPSAPYEEYYMCLYSCQYTCTYQCNN